MINAASNPEAYIEAYKNKDISLNYRGSSYSFALSQELFSSSGVDSGTILLLKSLSKYLDNNGEKLARKEDSYTVLDAGCGTGILGVCIAGALGKITHNACHVRCQDRDELARIFTEYNKRCNGIKEENLAVFTEPLLAGNCTWDLIVSNIPAKAGNPVLDDYIYRSLKLLKKDGAVFIVIVNTLKDFFISRIKKRGEIFFTESTVNHTVLAYKNTRSSNMTDKSSCIEFNDKFPAEYPFYIRNRNSYEMEKIIYKLDTVHGAADFDNPGGEVQAAAKLAIKINLLSKITNDVSILIHDAGQGHFALWLHHYLDGKNLKFTLSGRNCLALSAARAALSAAKTPEVNMIYAADLLFDSGKFADNYNLIAYFSDGAGGTDRIASSWDALCRLTLSDAIIIIAADSMEAERFDRKKPKAMQRISDIKRRGFRAIAYRKV